MKIISSIFLFIFLNHILLAQSINITPKPQKINVQKGQFFLNANTVIITDDVGQKNSVDYLNLYLKNQYGFSLKSATSATNNFIKLSTKKMLVAGTDGRYELQANPTGVSISGDTYAGVFYGIQSLIQLISPIENANKNGNKYFIPSVNIEDEPRFKYRGLHLDVGRHFYPVSFVKKYIDNIAFYKLNTFHWHLTEDQGWRIEIKKYPKLTSVGAWRDGTLIGRYPGKGNTNMRYGGFYTQEEIKEVVKYAAERFITIIPEIEMPGHSSAAIAAYPFLSCFPNETTIIPTIPSEASKGKTGKKVQETWGVFDDVFCPKDSTFHFLEDVLDEVMALFPSKYIHIGGDECPKVSWKRSEFCQQLIKEKGLKDEHGLQSYFIQTIEKYLNSKGRNIIGWDEILEGGLAPNATVMSWRGEQGGIDAAKQNHDVMMTPGDFCYFDHCQTKNEDSVTIGGYLPIEKVYSYNPVPASLSANEAKHILGAQANVWTEYMTNENKVEYMIFPRLAAFSEVLWTKSENKNWKDFEQRLPKILEGYDKKKLHFSRAFYEVKTTVIPTQNFDGVVWKLERKNNKAAFQITTEKPATAIGKNIIQLPDWKKDPTGKKGIFKDSLILGNTFSDTEKDGIGELTTIKKTGEYFATEFDVGQKVISITSQNFHFNIATGKKITLKEEPSKAYPGSGAFTLVDGIQNTKGFSKASEFIGFNGKDCDAVINLGKPTAINKITIHFLQNNYSWIYAPQLAEIQASVDGQQFTSQNAQLILDNKNDNGKMIISDFATDKKQAFQYLKILIKNAGTIPAGMPGAGNPAWLFLDEIEVE